MNTFFYQVNTKDILKSPKKTFSPGDQGGPKKLNLIGKGLRVCVLLGFNCQASVHCSLFVLIANVFVSGQLVPLKGRVWSKYVVRLLSRESILVQPLFNLVYILYYLCLFDPGGLYSPLSTFQKGSPFPEGGSRQPIHKIFSIVKWNRFSVNIKKSLPTTKSNPWLPLAFPSSHLF